MATSLPRLTATRWIDFKSSGRTQPALIACELPGGNEVECVVKLHGHRESAPHQPVCELVAALLALDLGLPVAEPMLVEITADFAQRAVPVANQAARVRCRESIGWVFGSKHLPSGYSVIPVGRQPGRVLTPILAELYAFDGLIQNADREAGNANCLVKGNDLRFFDHDHAFGFLLDIFGASPVSQLESYAFLRHHLAHPHLTRDRTLFNRIEGAWEAVTDEMLTGYFAQLPDSWPGKEVYFPKIEVYLKEIRDALASALDAITLSLPSS